MSKSDQYRRLGKFDITMNDDGTNIQFVFHGEDGEPARFHTGVEGLGLLLKVLKDRARAMVEKLTKSGAAEKYREGIFDLEPDRVLSIQVGVVKPDNELSIAVQMEDGSLVRMLWPTTEAVRIAEEIIRLKSELSATSKPPARH
jgi:hypothetical protein